MSYPKEVVQLAAGQHYVVATWQLEMLGMSNKAIAALVSRQAWTRSHRGVMQLPAPADRIRDLAAAVLAYSRPAGAASRVAALQAEGAEYVAALIEAALGCGQAVTGPSALWMYGLDIWSDSPWLRLPRGCGNATRGSVLIRHGDPVVESVRLRGLPIVAVEQAFLDLPGCLPDLRGAALHHYMASLASAADAKRLTDIGRVGAVLDKAGRIVGGTAWRNVLDDLGGTLSHSGTEARARQTVTEIARAMGLTVVQRPHAIEYEGRRVGEADIAVLEIALDVEVDGPHHLAPAQQAKDRARDKLVRRAGWEVERYPVELIDLRPTVFAAQVRDAIKVRWETLSDHGLFPVGNKRM